MHGVPRRLGRRLHGSGIMTENPLNPVPNQFAAFQSMFTNVANPLLVDSHTLGEFADSDLVYPHEPSDFTPYHAVVFDVPFHN